MWVNENFINIFFFIPAIVVYIVFVNVLYFMAPYILFFFLRQIKKEFIIKDVYMYYKIFTVIINLILMLLIILEFKLYKKSYLYWP